MDKLTRSHLASGLRMARVARGFMTIDPGIGGGLIAIAAAIVALPPVGGFVFSRLSQRK